MSTFITPLVRDNEQRHEARLKRNLEAYALYKSGLTLRQVGERLNISHEHARRMIRWVTYRQEHPDKYRALYPELF